MVFSSSAKSSQKPVEAEYKSLELSPKGDGYFDTDLGEVGVLQDESLNTA